MAICPSALLKACGRSPNIPGDHVANQAPAGTELERAFRQEISIPEALANMDAYLQDQEDQARERIAG